MPVITLDQAKARVDLALDEFEQDDAVTAMIRTAQAAVEQYLNRRIEVAAYTDTISGNGKDRITLSNTPIVEVQTVTINGQAVPESSGYGSSGFLHDGNVVLLRNRVFDKGLKNVVVTYRAGYETVPPEVREAVLQTFHAIYSSQGLDPNMTGENVGSVYSAAFSPLGLGAVPFGARSLLDSRRKYF